MRGSLNCFGSRETIISLSAHYCYSFNLFPLNEAEFDIIRERHGHFYHLVIPYIPTFNKLCKVLFNAAAKISGSKDRWCISNLRAYPFSYAVNLELLMTFWWDLKIDWVGFSTSRRYLARTVYHFYKIWIQELPSAVTQPHVLMASRVIIVLFIRKF